MCEVHDFLYRQALLQNGKNVHFSESQLLGNCSHSSYIFCSRQSTLELQHLFAMLVDFEYIYINCIPYVLYNCECSIHFAERIIGRLTPKIKLRNCDY